MLYKLDAKIACGKLLLTEKVKEFLMKEDGDVNIVSIVVLIGIVIIVAGVFRKQITGLIEHLFEGLTTKGDEAIGVS